MEFLNKPKRVSAFNTSPRKPPISKRLKTRRASVLFVALFTAVLFFPSCDQPTDSKNGGGSGQNGGSSGGGGGAGGGPGEEKKGPDACSRALGINCSRFEEAYVKASNTDSNSFFGNQFGYSIALAGNTLAVGALKEASDATGINGRQDNTNAQGSGAVYVFTRSGSTWSQQAYIKASNTGENDNFGSSIALSGNTLAVGAPLEGSNATGVNADLTGGTGTQADNSSTTSGAVYVFTRSGSTWSQQAYIKASNTGSGDRFGSSIALSGDTLAVGAIWEDSNATGVNPTGTGGANPQADNSENASGAVYVFTRSKSIWSQQAYIKASNTGRDDRFGFSTALSGDTLAVGAYGEGSSATGVDGNQNDNSELWSGAVYVFIRSRSSDWSQQAYIKASNTDAYDYFGTSVALSGSTLAVGATNEESSATGVNGNQNDNSTLLGGAVYVFTRTGSTWSQEAYIKASNTDYADAFGSSVALSGSTLAVGALNERSSATGVNGNQSDNSKPDSGAVYLFTRAGSAWNQQAYIKASNTDANDQFGYSIALSGNTLAAGADDESSGATGINGNQGNTLGPAGAVYVRRIAP